MNIFEIMTQLADQLHLDANEMQGYAAEDDVGGYHINEAKRVWPMGSMWASEGQILYALVRALKPEKVVEIGGWVGCSAAHIATALRKNGTGHLYSVDNGVGGAVHGSAFPDDLRDVVEMIQANGQEWLALQADNSLDIVFEDADHSTPLVALLSKLALQKLKPGGVLVNHDAAHDHAIVGGGVLIDSPVGKWVRDGLSQAGALFRTYIENESDCGVAVSLKPRDFARDIHSEKVVVSAVPLETAYDTQTVLNIIPDQPELVETMAEIEQSTEVPTMGDMLHQVWPEIYPEPETSVLPDIPTSEPVAEPDKPVKRKPGRKKKAQ